MYELNLFNFFMLVADILKMKSTLNFIKHQLEDVKAVSEGTDKIIEIESFPLSSDKDLQIIEQNLTDENYFNELVI